MDEQEIRDLHHNIGELIKMQEGRDGAFTQGLLMAYRWVKKELGAIISDDPS